MLGDSKIKFGYIVISLVNLFGILFLKIKNFWFEVDNLNNANTLICIIKKRKLTL